MVDTVQAEAPADPGNAAAPETPIETPAAPSPAVLEAPPEREITPDWPSDWRTKLAGEDASSAKTLDRMGSPVDVFKSYRELQKKMSSEPRMPKQPGPESTAEERVAYRKELGIPEEPTGYDTKIADGYEWGEVDKPILEDFLKFAHNRDMPPGQVKNALSWWPEYNAKINQAREEQDYFYDKQSYETLRQEWGSDFQGMRTAAENLANTWPKEVRESVLQARDPYGRKLMHNQDFLRELASMSKTINPAATLVPAGTQDQGKALASRKTEIESMMGDHSTPYYRGPQLPDGGGTALMKEYRDILDAEAALKKRASN